MTNFDKDTWRTPKYIFNWLNKRFFFEIDGCADYRNKLCSKYVGVKPAFGDNDCLADDFLREELIQSLNEYAKNSCGYKPSIFVNPPYSDPLPFVQRAAELRKAGYLVVMLLPADKSVGWYSVIQEHATEVIDITGYYNAKGKFVSGRISFIHPETNEEVKGNNKGSMVAVFDPFVQGLVTRQVSLDFVRECGV